MIFKQVQEVLDGTKTQTRRLVKEGDLGLCLTVYRPDEITWVGYSNHRTRWTVLGDYAVQPGRGKKSIGRIRITKIRRERLQEIIADDCRAEGITDDDISAAWGPVGGTSIPIVLKHSFKALWNSLYRKPCRWEDNPDVWVLEFELV